jgi:hypothetical protein
VSHEKPTGVYKWPSAKGCKRDDLEYKKQWIHFVCDPFRMCASLDFGRDATGVRRPLGLEQQRG